MAAECGQSLAPEWLFINKESPSSFQADKSPTKHNNERDRGGRRNFAKQNSYHHLIHLSPSSSHSYSLSSSSNNWRVPDSNPRMLNRSKSSPVFDHKENVEVPKSPDRSNSGGVERHFASSAGLLPVRQKAKLKGKPALVSSRSQPNLFSADKTNWQQPKFRSPPPSRPTSLLVQSSSQIPSPRDSSPTPLAHSTPALVPTSMAMAVSSAPPQTTMTTNTSLTPIAPIPEGSDMEMLKFRTLVPSPSVASAATPKPPTRFVSSNPNRKHPKPHGRPEKPAVPPPNAQLRKQVSEPSLVNNLNAQPSAEDLVRKMRTMKLEKAKVALKETMEGQDAAVAKRNNFLMDVFKREKQIQDSAELEQDGIIMEEEPSSPETSCEPNTALPLLEEEPLVVRKQLGDQLQQKPLPNSEDEERFLRLLGWVPDEEDHVEELKEDEIAEVRLKIKQQGSPVASPRNNCNGLVDDDCCHARLTPTMCK